MFMIKMSQALLCLGLSLLLWLGGIPASSAITNAGMAAQGEIDFSSNGSPAIQLFNQYGGDAKDICFTLTNTGGKTIGVYFNGYADDGKAYTGKTVGLKDLGREIKSGTSALLCFNRIRSIVVQCPNTMGELSELSPPDLDVSECSLNWEVASIWNEVDDRAQKLG